MTVYRIVWILPSGEEIPDLETYHSATLASLQAFRIQAWAGIATDFEIAPTTDAKPISQAMPRRAA